jgi:hypothetical protein
MLAVLLFVGLGFAAYLLLSGVNAAADAPGHCDSLTQEPSNMKLSFSDLVTLASNAGFGCDANVAAAVALAESGGDPQAYNPETQACTPSGEGSFGLWQIYRKAHPEFACQDLTDPQTNASAAFKVYSEAGGFSPWSTFKSGKYQEYLQ